MLKTTSPLDEKLTVCASFAFQFPFLESSDVDMKFATFRSARSPGGSICKRGLSVQLSKFYCVLKDSKWLKSTEKLRGSPRSGEKLPAATNIGK